MPLSTIGKRTAYGAKASPTSSKAEWAFHAKPIFTIGFIRLIV